MCCSVVADDFDWSYRCSAILDEMLPDNSNNSQLNIVLVVKSSKVSEKKITKFQRNKSHLQPLIMLHGYEISTYIINQSKGGFDDR